jgi:hypothetical protein
MQDKRKKAALITPLTADFFLEAIFECLKLRSIIGPECSARKGAGYAKPAAQFLSTFSPSSRGAHNFTRVADLSPQRN